ncbi:cytochrome p450 [Moniliophthora roreri]|uniref:Cytochrome p450 n=1 Tax=Moniliophthora roreri TaxID=221103 RepID=A0A0W0G3N3_MONRR|nr:cytochrome p450 [Moniliophthora roreri]
MSDWSSKLHKQEPENLCLGLDREVDLLSAFIQENKRRKDARLRADGVESGYIFSTGGPAYNGKHSCLCFTPARQKPGLARHDSHGSLDPQGSIAYINLDKLEIICYHPIISHNERLAAQDTVLPLLEPIKTLDGRTLTALPIKKGQLVYCGLASYNRRLDIWGDDVEIFDPYRWIDDRSKRVMTGTSFGPFANLAPFIGGPQACLGWRFAIMEMQAMLADLLARFSFKTVEGVMIRPCMAATM